jgi:hypothetical protein
MYRRGRPVVSTFQADEQLYRRHRRADTLNGLILPSALQFPKKADDAHSVNRSSFGRPEDTLWNNTERLNGLGVFQFPASCLLKEAKCSDTGRRFTFFPKHVPLYNNYAHAEVWCDELPRRNAEYVLPTKLVWKELRATIQKNCHITIDADL